MLSKKNVIIVALSLVALAGGLGWWLFYAGRSGSTHIEMYQPADRPAIKKILEDDWHWLVAEGAFDFSADYMFEHRAPTYHYPDNSLSIAVYRTPEGKVGGFITYHQVEGFSGKIQFLGVASEFRKKGYGRELMSYALDALRKKGMCFVDIAVRASNTPAYNLYKSLGFKEVWQTPDGFIGLRKSLCGSLLGKDATPAPMEW